MELESNRRAGTALDSAYEYMTHSPAETRRLGAQLAALLLPGDVIALQGELGSGKTQFVKGLGRGLGVREPVHSPTFILANEYRSGRMPLFHVDAYRVENANEAIGFGLEDYLNDAGLTVVEWAERIRAALPVEHLWIEFSYAGDQDRRILMRAQGKHYAQRLEEFRPEPHPNPLLTKGREI